MSEEEEEAREIDSLRKWRRRGESHRRTEAIVALPLPPLSLSFSLSSLSLSFSLSLSSPRTFLLLLCSFRWIGKQEDDVVSSSRRQERRDSLGVAAPTRLLHSPVRKHRSEAEQIAGLIHLAARSLREVRRSSLAFMRSEYCEHPITTTNKGL